jgi:SCY1-like protein 1
VALSVWEGKPTASKEEWLIWGLHRIVVRQMSKIQFDLTRLTSPIIQIALAFVNDTCQSTHGNVRTDSIFISPSGEWKLGAFELLSNAKDDAAVLYVRSVTSPNASLY